MRFIYLLLAFLVLPALGQSQKTINKFINEIKKEKSCQAMTLPGWLVRAGAKYAFKYSEEEDSELEPLSKLVDKIKRVRFAIVENKREIKREDVNAFIHRLKHKDNFDEYVKVRDGKDLTNILVEEKKEKIKNLVILVDTEEEFVIFHLKTDFTLEDLKQIDFELMKKEESIPADTETVR